MSSATARTPKPASPPAKPSSAPPPTSRTSWSSPIAALAGLDWITPTPPTLTTYLYGLPVTHWRDQGFFGQWQFVPEWRTDDRQNLILNLDGIPPDKLLDRAADLAVERRILTPSDARYLRSHWQPPPGTRGANLFRDLITPAYEQLRAEDGRPVRKRKKEQPAPAPAQSSSPHIPGGSSMYRPRGIPCCWM